MKEILRKRFIKKRKKMSLEEIRKKSKKIIRRLIELDQFNQARTIHCYISKDSEVYTHNIIKYIHRIRKTCLIPYVHNKKIISFHFKRFGDLKEGKYGLFEPKIKKSSKIKKIDLTIVPGIVFDKEGNRIGYGKGYYDRFLKNNNSVKIGLAYDFQIIDKVPHKRKDVVIDYIITEKRTINCGNMGWYEI